MGVYSYQNDDAGGRLFGLYSYVSNGLSGFGVSAPSSQGITNIVNNGPGSVYGQYNYTYQQARTLDPGYGIYNYSDLGTQEEAYGIYNYLYAVRAGRSWGIYNYVSPGRLPAIGLYSSTQIGNGQAGYFDGDVHINGSLTVTSDERKKENIQVLQGALGIVQQLQGHTYTFAPDQNMNLPQGEQYGFLAQELESVLPTLVKTVENPNHPQFNPEEKKVPERAKVGEKPELQPAEDLGTETVKSVNYIGVIPILVEAIKEQQGQIEAQRAALEAQRQEIEQLRKEIRK